MNAKEKIISIGDNSFGTESDIVFCYGSFDLIHPGHLRYLQYAKTLADKLIVVLISDSGLDDKHHFSEVDRAENVANLHIVDNVIVLNHSTLSDLIGVVKPKILVLGREFENNKTKQIRDAISTVNKYGRVVFHAGENHYASSVLLHNNALDIERSSKYKFNKICHSYGINLDKLQAKMNSFSDTRLLVIGDTIVDHYVACDALGMSAEAPVLVVKELESRNFIGGAAIVASHIRALGADCHYISVAGEDKQASIVEKSLKSQNIKTDIFSDKSRPTTYKTRYMVENQKLFRVSRMSDHNISSDIENKIIKKITSIAEKIDGIVISDFVYGVITERVLESIKKMSDQFDIKLYGDLQCSSQVGKVSKFIGFDLITPTEKESRVALQDSESGIEWISSTLMDKTESKNMLMKLGSNGFVAYKKEKGEFVDRQDFPALSANPVDVTGAGDSLFSVMSVALSSGASLIEASVIGTCMAALAVEQLGNTPISRDELNEYISTVVM